MCSHVFRLDNFFFSLLFVQRGKESEHTHTHTKRNTNYECTVIDSYIRINGNRHHNLGSFIHENQIDDSLSDSDSIGVTSLN